MAYEKTVYANGNPPALNADNLNKSENELAILDGVGDRSIFAIGKNGGNQVIPITKYQHCIVTSYSTADVTNFVPDETCNVSVVACEESDVFTVNAYGGTTIKAWAFVSAEGNVLSKSGSNVDINNAVITAPANSAWLVINDRRNRASFYGRMVINDLEAEIGAKAEAIIRGYNVEFWVANNGKVEWTTHNFSSISYYIGSNNYLLKIKGQAKEITPAQISAAATNAGLTVSDGVITGTSYMIYYDMTNDVVKCQKDVTSTTAMGIQSKNPVIFYCHYGNIRDGLVVDYMTRRKVELFAYNTKFYLGNNGSVEWSKHGISNVSYKIGTNDYILRLNDQDITITPAQISAAATNAGLTVSNGIITGTSYMIYYDMVEKVVKCAKNVSNASGGLIYASRNPVIFYCHYGSVRAGLVCDYMNLKYTESNRDDVEAVEESVQSIQATLGDVTVPDYYLSHIQSKRDEIMQNMGEVGNKGETFIFITDIHWENNDKKSPALVNYLLNNLNINNLLCGGDIINEGEKETMMETMRECIVAFQHRNILMPCAYGNHDNNANGTQASEHFSVSEQYSLMQKQAENLVTYFTQTDYNNQNWNFYYDIKNTKTRIVVLDVGNNGSYNRFWALVPCLLETPENYNIVIMTHWLMGSAITETCNNLMALADAYNKKGNVTISGHVYDLSGAKGIVRLLLAGHVHNNYNWYTGDGIPVVLIDCDNGPRSLNTETPYVRNTVTQQSFGVFTLNYSTGSIKEVKVGRGFNKIYNAGSNEVNVGNTISLTTNISNPTWETEDSSIATVLSGTVSGVAAGNTIISAIGTSEKEYWYIKVQ